jgi:hypothetical protein
MFLNHLEECIDEFILEVTISLSDQFSGISISMRNIRFISKSGEIWRKFQKQKLLQIASLISTNFLIFVYFSR